MKNYAPIIITIILGFPFITFIFLKIFSTSVYRTIPYKYEVVGGDTLIYELPNFTLTDVNGASVSKEDLLGNVAIISFFDMNYRLGTVVLNGHLVRVFDNVKDSDFIKILSVSLDSSKVITYSDSINVDPNIWKFTTGDTAEVINLAQSIGLKDFGQNLLETSISGSNQVVVIDKEGKVRYHFVGTDLAEIKSLNEELRALILLEYPEEIGKN